MVEAILVIDTVRDFEFILFRRRTDGPPCNDTEKPVVAASADWRLVMGDKVEDSAGEGAVKNYEISHT